MLKVEFTLSPTENLLPEKSPHISTIYLIREKNMWSFNLPLVSELLAHSDLGSRHIPCFVCGFI